MFVARRSNSTARRRLTILGCMFLFGCGGEDSRSPSPQDPASFSNPILKHQTSGTTVLLQAVSVVDDRVVWVSGHGATFARTVDGGETWVPGVVPGPDTLQFRDVYAVSAETAYLLSAGPGDMSRIYKTTDAGQSWTLQFSNTDPRAFFDCMDFWDADRGLAFSDAVDGRLVIIRTGDGGENWTPVSPDAIPVAAGTEGGFAASGTCLVTRGEQDAWIGTGAGDAARVYHTADGGTTWSVVETPIVGGAGTTGITTLAFDDELGGFALGGDIGQPTMRTDNVAITSDGGASWTLAGRPVFSGAVYGASVVPGLPQAVVAVGPGGMDFSLDNATTWTSLDTLSYWSVGFASPQAGWAVGPAGRITKIRVR